VKQRVGVSSVGRTTGPLTPSPDAKKVASKLDRKGQPKKKFELKAIEIVKDKNQ